MFLVCLLMMFFTSCKTVKVVEKDVYVVPNLDFPEFPALEHYEKLEGGKVATDENFFRRLLIFKTSYSELIMEYNEKKNKLEER